MIDKGVLLSQIPALKCLYRTRFARAVTAWCFLTYLGRGYVAHALTG